MIYWVGFLSVLIAIESVFVGTCLSTFFPPQPSSLVHDFFATYQNAITPKHDVLFLRLFILVGVGSFMLLMHFYSSKARQKLTSLKYFTLLQAVVVITEVFFLFKFAVYRYPLWQNGFYASLIASVGIKIFTPEILKWVRSLDQRMKDPAPFLNLSGWLTAAGMVLMPLIIWVPDIEGAVARMFCGEQFHHIDGLLMSTGWSHLSGNILGVDTTSVVTGSEPLFLLPK